MGKKKVSLSKILEKMGDNMAEKISEGLQEQLEESKERSPNELAKRLDNIEDPDKKRYAKIGEFYKAMVKNDQQTLKALAEGTDSAGGFLTPSPVRAAIIERVQETSKIRPRATVIPVESDTLNLPRLDGSAQTSWTGENTSISTTSLTLGNLTLTPNKLASLLYLSTELVQDASVDIVEFVTNHLADRVRIEQDRAFVTGDGSSKPTGIEGNTGFTVDAGGDLSGDDLIDALYKLGQEYRRNAAWIIHKEDINEIRKLKDSNNNYLWEDLGNDQPAQLLGRPVVEDDDVGLGNIIVGDISQYYIGDSRDITVRTSDSAGNAWENDQISVRVTSRVDGLVAIAEAFAQINNASA